VPEAQGAWIALARQRGVSDKEFRLGIELWTHAGREPFQGQRRCWREGDGWAYKVWPRIEPRLDDPPQKQAQALTRRMGCKRRKVEQALSALCKKALIRRVSRPGGRPGKRERFNLQADTILLVPDSDSKAASPHVSTTESARSGQSDTHKRAEPNQLSHSTSLEQTNPPSIDAEPQPVGVGLDCFAGQADEPSEPADPACPVETVETSEADRTLEGLNAQQRHDVLEFWPDDAKRREVWQAAATPYTGKRSDSPEDRYGLRKSDLWRLIVRYPGVPIFAIYGEAHKDPSVWRDLEGLRREMDGESTDGFFDEDAVGPPATAPAPRSMNGLVEQMVSELRVERRTAEGLYADHQREPQRIRQAIFEVGQALKHGTCKNKGNPAGLLVWKLNEAAKRVASEGYSYTQ
jgi:hypothetical protein